MWYQLQIEQCHRDEVDSISEALEEMGALSITLTDKYDDPVLEPEPGTTPLWPDVIVNALYTDIKEAALAKQHLAAQFHHLSFAISELPDQDWERAWMDDFKPQCFGQRLWICPTWLEPPEPEAVNLILDPGLAFGTGTHPTTSLCLRWLDQAELANKTVIDYGCGSGILALAALKLGAARVQAVDIDEQALQATQSNALMNAIDSQQLDIGFPEILREPADVLIANILLAPLLTLRTQFKKLLNNEGVLIVSGILNEQAASLIEAYQADFAHQSSTDLEGWSLLTFTRR
ncbi:50S ribosomal protein L11 methyltransferase [Legionella maceachernii]|uniref:Ribosomal protein L11 methyltransferase n=1 Tax=Legionella maceachernii TaxID=466 RepID=A0A0W0VVD6_9GAMM|nr:50S ribosomal protein L11 methyltransferase [Legionella maceachernii]KTD23970.1 ribosomal protein L11 methyltransferase [Legionella maceachernii]SKA19142.1 ribosomal protein L11 methyltransferase [Legionella maceachernii]SUP04423.1 Ribosomal protein L11 methyltransferase [Legionella maceachernii]